ncbi:hypothetical protein [Chitinophaga cymbidii]|uniref:hypothetical protein n=1 Tax=Chitinophaga cymbidii TaxID=1096750 RepID=UPI0011BE3A08
MKFVYCIVFVSLCSGQLCAQNIFPSSGNVGIGTSTPNQRLHINGGNLKLTNPGGYPYGVNIDIDFAGGWAREFSLSYGGTGKLFAFGMLGLDSVMQYGYIGGNTTAFSPYSAPWMTFRPNGNIGIGTIAPGTYKLAVEGTIGARKVKVTQSAWADFVFEPDYHLPSLQELEQYIREHRHLPDIPTEQEVLAEGIDLGEMNKKLLQKVEELTLHVIDLNNRLKALEDK